jgi:hypothetical protein
MRKTFSFLWIIFGLAFAGCFSRRLELHHHRLWRFVTGGDSSESEFFLVGGIRHSQLYRARFGIDVLWFRPLSGVLRGVTPASYSHNYLYTGSLLLSRPFTVNALKG